MKYIATINGKRYEIELERIDEYCPLSRGERQRLQEKEHKSVYQTKNTIENQTENETAVHTLGGTSKNETAETTPKGAAENETEVESPLAGKVTAVLVKEGQTVGAGDVLLMIEAMKMETEIVAPVGGTAANISVKPNQQVESGECLLKIR